MKGLYGKRRIYKKILLGFISLTILLLLSFYSFMHSRVPQMTGELKLQKLDAPVEVLRDKNGIPHIYAKNNLDAFRVLGYVMASERLFQMEIARRMAKGELAEIFGKKALKSDILFRNLGLNFFAKKSYEYKIKNNLLNLEMFQEMNAYYDGVNQFISTGALPVEFKILGIKPKEFSAIDGHTFTGLMGFSFGIALMMEPLLTQLSEQIGKDFTEEMRNEKIPGSNSFFVRQKEKQFPINSKILTIIKDLEQGHLLFEGSNGWVLSGARTQSGFPILANDPHITYTNPGVWFEAHLKTPTYESYGHFLPLIPFPVLSHNRKRAWGITMSLVDDMDLYREFINYKKESYRFKNKEVPLSKRNEVLKIKNELDQNLVVFSTHHGPVLNWELLSTQKKESLALAWPYFDLDNDPLKSLYEMGRARSMKEFKAAVATGKTPGLNILYADEKNIGHWIFGKIWKKKKGLKTDFLLDGASGNDEIKGELLFHEKPHAENPVSGVIVSANNRPEGYPKEMRGDWQPDDRYQTIFKILMQKNKWSPEEIMEIQTLNMNFENKEIIKILLEELEGSSRTKSYQKSLEIIKKWDLISEEDSLGSTIFYSWMRNLLKELLVDLSKTEKEIFAKTPNGHIFLKRLLRDKKSIWWNRFNRKDIIANSFYKTVDELKKNKGKDEKKWQWGKIHTIAFSHPLGAIKPLNLLFNLGPYPIGGATQEVNNQKSSNLEGDFLVTAGPSTRRIIDFAHPEKSWGILPMGNSGHRFSPFYSDQVKMFLAGKYREQFLNLDQKSPEILFNINFIPQK